MGLRALNPLAPAFVPAARLHVCSVPGTADLAAIPDLRGFGHLPDEVLASILGCIRRPQDVFAMAAASKNLCGIARHAALNLRIASPKAYPHSVPGDLELKVRVTLHGVMHAFKGVQALDLSNTLVDDVDIIRVLQELPNLRILNLAGCRKLTTIGLDVLESRTGLQLEFLSLQRCFQAKDEVLPELLEAASTSKQTLRCIAVSHLKLQQWSASQAPAPHSWPGEVTSSDVDMQKYGEDEEGRHQALPLSTSLQPQQGSSLHALALHNCQGITSAGLQAVATACPQLQMLFLGGSTLSILKSTAVGSAAQPGQIPLLNGVPRSRAATITTILQKAPAHWHPSAHQTASELASLLQHLPQLLLLEITFLPFGVRNVLRSLLQSHNSQQDTQAVHVLDMCEGSSIAAAACKHSKLYRDIASMTDEASALGHQKQQHLRLLLEAAANCSNAARQTPLHVAVDSKDAQAAQGLLQLGSGINARDKGGATPLFVACEGGHAGCASLMLQAGADVLLRNTAGEAPLYIAALRGEGCVVDVLLLHMQSHGICWQDGKLYGDGWTPLMAAAVADRHGIAVRLLSAAGTAVGALVRHANRYGQTAVHIAARKGSLPMLTALLNIGGPAVALARDCVGTSPADIASKNNHAAAVELLCAAAANRVAPQPYSRAQHVMA